MLAVGVPLVVILRQLASATLASQRVKFAIASEEVGQPSIQLVLFVGLGMLLGWTLRSALLSVVASLGLACVLAAGFVVWLYPELLRRGAPSMSVIPEVVSFSVPMAFAGFFGSFSLWADRLVAGYFLGESDTGVYAAVSVITGTFAMILSGVKQILSPMVSDLYPRGEAHQVEALYRLGTRWALYATMPLLLSVCLAPKELLGVVFGEAYAGGALPLVVLSVAQLVNVATGPYDTLLVMTGRQRAWLILSALMLLANVGLVALLAPSLGLLGASLGMAGSVISISVVGVIVVYRVLGMTPYDRRYWKGLVAGAVTFAVTLAAGSLHRPTSVMGIAGWIGGAYVCFTVCLVVLGLEKDDIEVLRAARARVLKD
jgi:O-antigen/teichoic acid export membrane protein